METEMRNIVFKVPKNCTECGCVRRERGRYRCSWRYEDEGQEIPPEGLTERPIPFCPIDGVLVEGGEIIPILAYEIMRILKGEKNGR